MDNLNPRFRNMSLLVPRDRIEACVPGIDRYHGRPLPRELPGVSLLRGHLLSLCTAADTLPQTLSEPISEATFSLVAAAFRDAPGIRTSIEKASPEAIGACLIPQIRRHIRDNLASSELTPASIARHFGISKAQLYRVMEPVGGVAAFIRQQRLRACRRDLHNPAFRHLLIGEIAYKHGFSNIASFNRQFRQEFNCAPGDARCRMLELPPGSTSDRLYQDWIRLLNAVGG